MSYDTEKKKITLGGLKECLRRNKNYTDYVALKAKSQNTSPFLIAYPMLTILPPPIILKKEE